MTGTKIGFCRGSSFLQNVTICSEILTGVVVGLSVCIMAEVDAADVQRFSRKRPLEGSNCLCFFVLGFYTPLYVRKAAQTSFIPLSNRLRRRSAYLKGSRYEGIRHSL